MTTDYQKKLIKLIPLQNNSYRVDEYYYDNENNLIEKKQGETIPIQLFGENEDQLTRAFKPIILSFIDNADNLSTRGNYLIGEENGKKIALTFPPTTVSKNFILKAIAKKETYEKTLTTRADVKHVLIKAPNKEQLQISLAYDDNHIEQQTIKSESNIVRTVILPLLNKVWGEKEQLQHLIEETNAFLAKNKKLYYTIRNTSGSTFNIEIHPYCFDIFSIKTLEREIYDEIDFPKLQAIENNIKYYNHNKENEYPTDPKHKKNM